MTHDTVLIVTIVGIQLLVLMFHMTKSLLNYSKPKKAEFSSTLMYLNYLFISDFTTICYSVL